MGQWAPQHKLLKDPQKAPACSFAFHFLSLSCFSCLCGILHIFVGVWGCFVVIFVVFCCFKKKKKHLLNLCVFLTFVSSQVWCDVRSILKGIYYADFQLRVFVVGHYRSNFTAFTAQNNHCSELYECTVISSSKDILQPLHHLSFLFSDWLHRMFLWVLHRKNCNCNLSVQSRLCLWWLIHTLTNMNLPTLFKRLVEVYFWTA